MPAEGTGVRWGILGTANIAKTFRRAIERAPGARLVAVASRSAERARTWAQEQAVPRAHASYQALLEDPDLEAVYIPLPNSMHAEWTIRAAERGKHVLCEKPLATSASDAVAMVQACRRHGVQLMDATMWVHHDRTARMYQHLESGELGPLRRVNSAFSFPWNEWPQNDIRLQRELGGGCLADLGWYCIRAALWAMRDMPTAVFAAARFVQDCDVHLSAILWFDGERMASFDCGFDTVNRRWVEIAGTQRSLVCDDFFMPWKEETARYWIHEPAGTSIAHAVSGCVQEVRMIETFGRLVRSGTLDETWGIESIRGLRVLEALDRSARSGCRAQVND